MLPLVKPVALLADRKSKDIDMACAQIA